jgi:hypothetical protein
MHSLQGPACAKALPRFAPAALLATAGWPLAMFGQFLLVTALLALSGPGRIDIVDGQTRYEVARSLADHGDSIIRDDAAWFAVYKGKGGEKYTDYRIPQSALGVLAIHVADATGMSLRPSRPFAAWTRQNAEPHAAGLLLPKT